MLVDLHIHTTRYSGCARSDPEEMVAQACRLGLGALVFTEHHVIWPADELQELQLCFPQIKLLRGIEVTSSEGDDYLIYGKPTPGLYQTGMPGIEIIRRAHQQAAFVVLAHPYRYTLQVPEFDQGEVVDGAEVLSIHILAHAHVRARALVRRLGIAALAASDAHHVEALGLYAIRTRVPVRDEIHLADLLRRQCYTLYADAGRIRALNVELEQHLSEARGLIAAGHEDAAIRKALPALTLTMIQGLRAGYDVHRPAGG